MAEIFEYYREEDDVEALKEAQYVCNVVGDVLVEAFYRCQDPSIIEEMVVVMHSLVYSKLHDNIKKSLDRVLEKVCTILFTKDESISSLKEKSAEFVSHLAGHYDEEFNPFLGPIAEKTISFLAQSLEINEEHPDIYLFELLNSFLSSNELALQGSLQNETFVLLVRKAVLPNLIEVVDETDVIETVGHNEQNVFMKILKNVARANKTLCQSFIELAVEQLQVGNLIASLKLLLCLEFIPNPKQHPHGQSQKHKSKQIINSVVNEQDMVKMQESLREVTKKVFEYVVQNGLYNGLEYSSINF